MKYLKIMIAGVALLGLASGVLAAAKQEAVRLSPTQMKQIRGESLVTYRWNGSQFVQISYQEFQGPFYQFFQNSDGSMWRITQTDYPGGSTRVHFQSPRPVY